MFLHLGSDVMVPVKDVLAIYDYKTMELETNQKMLETMMREKEVVEISKEAKSFIFTDDKIYLSVISSLTLKKRAQSVKAMMAEK
ncbi:MAG: DUF370 domain-containing protein [Selenomonadales bacterium]|nr:DUF370 domain-containing protein [Selenomonadales bacterium]